MLNTFEHRSTGLTSPVQHSFDITPSDDQDLPFVTRGLYVGVSGDIQMTMLGGETVTRKNVPVGLWPWMITRIWNTDTTATDMQGDY